MPFFFKQWGNWLPASGPEDPAGWTNWQGELPDDLDRRTFHEFPDGYQLVRLGKKAAGRLLDGREHNDFPATGVAT